MNNTLFKSLTILIACTMSSLLYADGAETFKKKCGICHKLEVDGSAIASGKTGPVLTGLASKRPVDYLKLYMSNPDEAKKKFADVYNANKGNYSIKMPKIKVSDEEIEEILALMK